MFGGNFAPAKELNRPVLWITVMIVRRTRGSTRRDIGRSTKYPWRCGHGHCEVVLGIRIRIGWPQSLDYGRFRSDAYLDLLPGGHICETARLGPLFKGHFPWLRLPVRAAEWTRLTWAENGDLCSRSSRPLYGHLLGNSAACETESTLSKVDAPPYG